MGLRNSPCIAVPATAKPMPTRAPRRTLGSLTWRTMLASTGVQSLMRRASARGMRMRRILATLRKGIPTGPTAVAPTMTRNSIIARARVVSLQRRKRSM